jgi:hypothetical protein
VGRETMMAWKRSFGPVALFLVLALCPCLFGSGQFWDFLGQTQINDSQRHCKIQIVRPDQLYRTIQMRISGEAIFLDRLVVHFDCKGSQVITVSRRISPEEKSYTIELPVEGRALESVEVWYYKEPWEHTPRVILYGVRTKEIGSDSPAEEH